MRKNKFILIVFLILIFVLSSFSVVAEQIKFNDDTWLKIAEVINSPVNGLDGDFSRRDKVAKRYGFISWNAGLFGGGQKLEIDNKKYDVDDLKGSLNRKIRQDKLLHDTVYDNVSYERGRSAIFLSNGNLKRYVASAYERRAFRRNRKLFSDPEISEISNIKIDNVNNTNRIKEIGILVDDISTDNLKKEYKILKDKKLPTKQDIIDRDLLLKEINFRKNNKRYAWEINNIVKGNEDYNFFDDVFEYDGEVYFVKDNFFVDKNSKNKYLKDNKFNLSNSKLGIVDSGSYKNNNGEKLNVNNKLSVVSFGEDSSGNNVLDKIKRYESYLKKLSIYRGNLNKAKIKIEKSKRINAKKDWIERIDSLINKIKVFENEIKMKISGDTK